MRTMLRLTARQRAVLADKVPDVTNIILGALAIGVFVDAPGTSWRILAVGLAVWTCVLGFAVVISKGGK